MRQSVAREAPLPRSLTTGEMADLINQILQAVVYDDRAIRAEIDAGRIRAIPIGLGLRRARRLKVTPEEFLRWAGQVLHAEELIRLQAQLDRAS